jgi:hypothetical protein
MAVSLTQFNNNLIDPSGWTAGTGGIGIFGANGDANEQNRYVGTNPWGGSSMVWQCTSTGGNDASGGWNTSGVSIDQTKLYRFSVWVRRTSATSGGTFYFGLQSSTGNVVNIANGGTEGNPYWDYRGTGALTQNQWYLFVGHCFPYNHNGNQPHIESGVYTTSGRVGNNGGNIPGDCKWTSGTTTGVHRTYHYYCTDTTTRIEFFWPRMDKVDGTEPTIASLLATNIQQGIQFSDGTRQTSRPTGVQWQNITEKGDLIDITSFASSGTWTNPGASMVHVKLIGGGGGAAGYCESGGAGGFAEGFFNVNGIGSVAVTVGGGGGNVGYYAAAGQGGTSSFGSYLSAIGGYGANQQYSHSGGHGGNSFGGAQFSVQGGAGCGHINSVGSHSGGKGGAGYFGGNPGFIRNHQNLAASSTGKMTGGAPGSGGPGNITDGSGFHTAGAVGMAGLVVVYSYR